MQIISFGKDLEKKCHLLWKSFIPQRSSLFSIAWFGFRTIILTFFHQINRSIKHTSKKKATQKMPHKNISQCNLAYCKVACPICDFGVSGDSGRRANLLYNWRKKCKETQKMHLFPGKKIQVLQMQLAYCPLPAQQLCGERQKPNSGSNLVDQPSRHPKKQCIAKKKENSWWCERHGISWAGGRGKQKKTSLLFENYPITSTLGSLHSLTSRPKMA